MDAGCLITQMPDHLKNITVDNLMDDTGKKRDIDLIEDIFNDRDAALVKRVPIPLIDKNWFWIRE